MADILETLASAAADAKESIKVAKTDITAGASVIKADVKGLVVSRLNDLVLTGIILGSIWIGHLLK